MKRIIRKIIALLGYELQKKLNPLPAGSIERPEGNMKILLEDLKFRGLDGSSVMDVGANRGYWSKMAKNIFSNAKFCLIEPQVEMEELLSSFCDSTANSVYFMAGAGAQAEQRYLTVWDDMDGSSFLPHENETLKGSGKQRAIDIITIDGIIEDKKFPVPQLVKLDIQGFELEALKGAEKLFGKTEVFILEVSLFPFDDVPGMPVISDVINFMLERGYVVYDFPGFLRRPLDGALGQCDICFVRKDSFLRASHKWS
jgi:FkbM family methyltransferase